MKIQVYEKSIGIREVTATLVADMVDCGGETFPGVTIDAPYALALDTAAYAINEGGVMRDIWDYDEPDGSISMAFCVSEASADELYALRLTNAQLPAAAEVTLPSGEILIANEDGVLSRNGRVVGLSELGPDFSLTAAVQHVLERPPRRPN